MFFYGFLLYRLFSNFLYIIFLYLPNINVHMRPIT